jgi:ATP-binding cassette subfamily F protein 3
MAILTVNHIQQSFGEEVILQDISFEMQKSERVGLVGVNGSGKTTLFKVLTGEYTPDAGTVVFGKDTVLGYMEQHVCRDFHKTAFEEVMTVFAPLLRMERELEDLANLLSSHPGEEEMERLIFRQSELNDRFVDAGGLTCRSRARSALLGLGFTEEQLENRVGVLSGGQKAKLQLAKMLLGGANLLLLDEPTNHLDIQAVEWLEDFLKNYSGAYIVISHDRYFLDKVTERTLEMENKTIVSYKGNYSRHLELREERRLAMQRVYENTQKEIQRIEGIIEQQRRWNQERNYVTIASKQKQIDRLEATLERPEEDPESIRFQFKASRRGGNDVLTAQDLSLSFGGPKLFENVGLEIKHGEKVFLIGPNGCGKTSLFKILLGQYTPDTGVVRLGSAIDVGYYEQSQLSLHDEKTVMDEIWDIHPQMTQTQVRSALAVFLFKGEDVFKLVGTLSGGERARVLLLKLMLSKANFLLLDEPTNHLDIGSCEALENALSGYDGTLFVVSHDRYLINKLADKVYVLGKEGAKLYLGNYDSYLEQREKEQAAAQEQNPQPVKVNLYKLRKEREADLRKRRTALSRLEEAIEENEGRIQALEEKLQDPEVAADYEAVTTTSQEIAGLHEKGESLLLEWTQLSEELEELEQAASQER